MIGTKSNIEARLAASIACDAHNGTSSDRFVFEKQVKEAITELTTLRAQCNRAVPVSADELARLREDAARYQTLRSCTGHILAGIDPNENDGNLQWLDGSDLDEAVDADIKAIANKQFIAEFKVAAAAMDTDPDYALHDAARKVPHA